MITNKFTILLFFGILIFNLLATSAYSRTAEEWVKLMDKNLSYEAAEYTYRMKIHLPNGKEREFSFFGKTQGEEYALIEYVDPPREKGVRYLKRDDNLWIYFPRQDKTMLVQGHMLREGVQGGDFSYEDMTESKTLLDKYTARIVEENDSTVIIELEANSMDVSYTFRRVTIDKKTGIPQKSILSGVGNKPIKEMRILKTKRYGDRIFPVETEIRSLLIENKWTKLITDEIEFKKPFPESVFSKENLER